LKKVVKSCVSVLNNVEVSSINDSGNQVEIRFENGFEFKSGKVFLCTNAFTKKLYDLDVTPARAQVLITKPIENLAFKGCFHMDEGFYYFRNVGNRLLFEIGTASCRERV